MCEAQQRECVCGDRLSECLSTHPQHSFEVEPAGWARVLQLEPLVHGEIRGDQEPGQRNGKAAQRQGAVIILHLIEREREIERDTDRGEGEEEGSDNSTAVETGN